MAYAELAQAVARHVLGRGAAQSVEARELAKSRAVQLPACSIKFAEVFSVSDTPVALLSFVGVAAGEKNIICLCPRKLLA